MKDKEKENILNLRFAEQFTESEAVEHFAYMTSQTRLKHTNEDNIQKQWRMKRLGSLLKRLDRQRFDEIQPGTGNISRIFEARVK